MAPPPSDVISFLNLNFSNTSSVVGLKINFCCGVSQPAIARLRSSIEAQGGRCKGRLLKNRLFHHPDPDVISVQRWFNLDCIWISLHASVSIEGSNRAGLRQLCHYSVGSSVNLSLLSYAEPNDPDRSELELHLMRK